MRSLPPKGTFGSRLLAQEVLDEFAEFCDVRDYCLSEMRMELRRSEDDIIEESNGFAVERIKQYIGSFDHCPSCGNDLLRDEIANLDYCPVCHE